MSERARYMAREITHDEYYGMVVDLVGFKHLVGMLAVTKEEIATALKNGDWYLNTIKLARWDSRFGLFSQSPINKEEKLRITGSSGWTLSDCVCTLKCAARRWASEQGES